jgi:hypothetical protein
MKRSFWKRFTSEGSKKLCRQMLLQGLIEGEDLNSSSSMRRMGEKRIIIT